MNSEEIPEEKALDAFLEESIQKFQLEQSHQKYLHQFQRCHTEGIAERITADMLGKFQEEFLKKSFRKSL